VTIALLGKRKAAAIQQQFNYYSTPSLMLVLKMALRLTENVNRF
jgi:hypothetical protein